MLTRSHRCRTTTASHPSMARHPDELPSPLLRGASVQGRVNKLVEGERLVDGDPIVHESVL